MTQTLTSRRQQPLGRRFVPLPDALMRRLPLLLLLLRGNDTFGYQSVNSQPRHDHVKSLDRFNRIVPIESSSGSDRRTAIRSILTAAIPFPALHVVKSPSNALSPKEAATAYDSFAPTYNALDGGQAASLLGIEEARSQLLAKARGNVLEIGVGTGLNLDKYDPSQISTFTFVDISDGMLQEAKKRLDGDNSNLLRLKGVPVKFVNADATSQLVDLFGKESFDTVVDTFSLCVFGNEGAKKSLKEMRQVVKEKNAGGQVLLFENSRSSNPLLGLYQDATADAAASVGGKGCVYNQDVSRLIRDSGMTIARQKEYAAGLFQAFECTAPAT